MNMRYLKGVEIMVASALALTAPGHLRADTVEMRSSPVVTDESKASIDRGRALFTQTGCGGCHSFAEAGTIGYVAPALNGRPGMTEASFPVDRISNGQNQMPGFRTMLSKEEIADIAAYVAAHQ